MALYDGKNIKGSIGNISFRKIDKNTTTVQSNPGKGNMKQTANTKKSASLFGKIVSPFAKHIRFNFNSLINGFADRKMVNRMNSAIAIVINQHLQEDGSILFNANSFNRLSGFEFNTASPLVNSLLLMPELNFLANEVQITLPQLKTGKDIKFPEQATQLLLQIQPLFFCLSKGRGFRANTIQLVIDKHQTLIEEQTFTFPFPPATICLIGVNLLFTNNKIAFNHKGFNPAGICAASYNEGIADDLAMQAWYPTGITTA